MYIKCSELYIVGNIVHPRNKHVSRHPFAGRRLASFKKIKLYIYRNQLVRESHE